MRDFSKFQLMWMDAVGTPLICKQISFSFTFLPAEVKNVAGALTPVPGGVGPMTVAMLMKNTFQAARNIRDSDKQAMVCINNLAMYMDDRDDTLQYIGFVERCLCQSYKKVYPSAMDNI